MKVSKAEAMAHAQELKRLNQDIASDEIRVALWGNIGNTLSLTDQYSTPHQYTFKLE